MLRRGTEDDGGIARAWVHPSRGPDRDRAHAPDRRGGHGPADERARPRTRRPGARRGHPAARAFIERIGREVRQGNSVTSATASTFTLVTYVHTTSCGTDRGATARRSSAGSHTRAEPRARARCATWTGPARRPVQTLVGGLSGQPVFTYASAYSAAPCPGSSSGTNPAYVCIRLRFPRPTATSP